MKKLIFTILIFTAFSTQLATAQGLKDKFFYTLSQGVFTDFYTLPTTNILTSYYLNGSVLEGNYTAETPFGYSIYTVGSKLRLNLVDLSDDASISVHTLPAFGISLVISDNTDGMFGSFSLPLMVGYNTGNVSTYTTSKDKGFGIAVGFEYFNGGLIGSKEYETSYTDINGNNVTMTTEIKNSKFFVPAFELAYRYWSRSNKARELALQASFGGKSDLETDPGFNSIIQNGSAKGPWHVRLTWGTYFNY